MKKLLFKLPLTKNLKRRLDSIETHHDTLRAEVGWMRAFAAQSQYAVAQQNLDDLATVRQAYSLGVGNEVSWDLAMAERNIPVHLFDYSVEYLPARHRLFTFFRRKVTSIGDILQPNATGELLKIDIEGAEWDFFDQASPAELGRFSQIIGEFHDFDRYYDPHWYARALRVLAKLHQTHQLVHIHANNGSPVFRAGQRNMPFVLELSFALRAKYDFAATDEPFPGPLDYPNIPKIADILWMRC